mgnify:CR=1 FL=1
MIPNGRINCVEALDSKSVYILILEDACMGIKDNNPTKYMDFSKTRLYDNIHHLTLRHYEDWV